MSLSNEPRRPAVEVFEWDLDRMVFLRPDGLWVNQRQNAPSDATVHRSQDEAIAEARRMLKTQHGGELIVFGSDGRIVRFSDTHAEDD